MPNSLDPSRPIPLYFQLKTVLLEEILSGRYGAGDRLPTEHELCARYAISRTPVTRALSELAEEGVILRHRRRGTFVNPHWVHRQSDGRELRVVVPDGPWGDLIRRAAPPGVRLNVATVRLPDLHQVLTHAVAEGRAPDLAVIDSVWVAEFSAAGFLWPLDELDGEWLRSEYERDFLETFLAANRYEGKTLAVQAEADVAGVWCARDDLESAGLEPPTTWDELLATAQALGRRRGKPAPIVLPGGSTGGETTTYCLLALLASNGASVLGPEGVTLDNPAAVEALEFLRRLIEVGAIPPEVVVYEWDRPIRLLAQRQASFSFGGSYESRTLAESAGVPMTELSEQFAFIPMPAGPRKSPAALAGGMVYGIFRQAAYPSLAMQVLKLLASPAALAEMSAETAQIPPRRSAIDLVAQDSPFIAETARMLSHAVVRPATPDYARVSAQLRAMLEAVLTRRLDPAAACERTAEMIAAITGLAVVRR